MLELYHHGTSASAAKVRFALEEKHLEWRGRYIDILRGEQFAPDYLKINPQGVVPTLVHNGAIIPESTVICEYLEEIFPDHPIFPKDAVERATVRIWNKAVDEQLHSACAAITYVSSHRHTILRNGVGTFEEFLAKGGQEDVTARKLKWQWIQEGLAAPGVTENIGIYDRHLRRMEDALSKSAWLAGAEITMSDIALAPYVNRLAALAMTGFWCNGRLPRVEAWFDRLQKRPAFKSAIVDWAPEPLAAEMLENGSRAWPKIKSILDI